MADSLTEDMFHLAHLHQGRRCNYQGEAAGQAKKKRKDSSVGAATLGVQQITCADGRRGES